MANHSFVFIQFQIPNVFLDQRRQSEEGKLRTFLKPKAPQIHPDVHYSICAVSTAHHNMTDMLCTWLQMRKCVSPRLDLGNYPMIIKSQVPQVNWMTFVSPFSEPFASETLSFSTGPPPGVYPNLMATASCGAFYASQSFSVAKTPWVPKCWVESQLVGGSGSPATGLGQMLLTFHSWCTFGPSLRRSRLACSHRQRAVKALRDVCHGVHSRSSEPEGTSPQRCRTPKGPWCCRRPCGALRWQAASQVHLGHSDAIRHPHSAHSPPRCLLSFARGLQASYLQSGWCSSAATFCSDGTSS